MYSENPSGNSMNTASAARLGATNKRPAHARRREGLEFFGLFCGYPRGRLNPGHGLCSTSSTRRDNPVSDVAGRDPRSTGGKYRSIRASTFSQAGVIGRPSE